jgi:hypothetical protein
MDEHIHSEDYRSFLPIGKTGKLNWQLVKARWKALSSTERLLEVWHWTDLGFLLEDIFW